MGSRSGQESSTSSSRRSKRSKNEQSSEIYYLVRADWKARLVECDRLKADCERLRTELAKAHADSLIANMRYVEQNAERNTVIEECAKTIEDWPVLLPSYRRLCEDIAGAIRAMKQL